MNEYDPAEAFRRIENELMASMIRNMARHRVEEIGEGYEWSMWQAEMLKSLERYKRTNRRKYGKQFKSINSQIAALIREARAQGCMRQETAILRAIQRGWKFPQIPEGILQVMEGLEGADISQKIPRLLEMLLEGKTGKFTGEFFGLNDRKLDALIKAAMQDMEKAETAVLRKANDDFRKAIFNAQVYANTGVGTYEQAVDMATKDMLSRGLNCVEYANGARHTLADYADMAIRTASKRAYLQGEGEMRRRWGIHTVIMNKRGNPCPKCLPFCGKVLIDDVWSGGSPDEGPWPLMSRAIEAGLYHPRCKDSHTTYFPGITTADGSWTEEELAAIGQSSRQEARRQYAERQAAKFGRLAKYSLDPENRKRYQRKADEWESQSQKVYRNLTEDEYDQLVEAGKSFVTQKEKDSIAGFDWGNFKPANLNFGYINTENSFLINKAIRENKVSKLPVESQKTIDCLKNIIERSRIDVNIKGRRYVDKNWLDAQFGENPDFEDIIAKKRIFTDEQFVSCSLTEEISFNTREVEIIFEIPAGTHIYITDNRMESEAIMYKPLYIIKGVHKGAVAEGDTKERIQLICEVLENE